MSCPAAIVNPLDKDRREALLYYVTGHGTLAIEHRPLGESDYRAFQDNSNNDFQGPISWPGQLAAVHHAKLVVVYGFTKSLNDKKEVEIYLAQISPVINPLSTYTNDLARAGKWHALAAVTDGQGRDYIYFFKNETEPKDPAKPGPRIIEFQADVKNAAPRAADIEGNPSEVFPGAKPNVESHLAVIYDHSSSHGNRRTIFFQQRDDKKDSIYYQFTGSQAPVKIEDTNARQGSPLAAVTVPKEGADSIVHLYYADKDDYLTRVTRKNGEWLSPATISENPIQVNSEISAVWDAGKKAVQVFLRLEGKEHTTFIQVEDDGNPRS